MSARLFAMFASVVVLSGCISAPDFSDSEPEARAEQEAAVKSHARLAAVLQQCRTAPVEVFEGLPHPRWEKQALERESRRPDTFENHESRFYSPAIPMLGSVQKSLLRLVTSEASYRSWRGVKFCGGFHPDLLLRFAAPEGTINVHLCFGCDEAMFFDGTGFILVDMKERTSAQLEQIQKANRNKRPFAARGI